MERVPEPELMEEKEQVISYDEADFSEGEVNLINQINQYSSRIGLWHRLCTTGRQDRGSRQCLCRSRKEAGVWSGRHRHDRRTKRSAGDSRWHFGCGMG